MNETTTNTASTWAKAASVHLAVVALSFVPSFMLLQRVRLMPGEVLECMAISFLLFYAVVAVVATLIRKVSVLSCLFVFAIAFIPGGCLGIDEIQKEVKYRYYLPHDRFRDNLALPVPTSVTNLRFVPLQERIRPDLMFQFDIATADLDAILKDLKMERVDPNKMLNPKDFFQYPYYLPMEGGYQVFQGRSKYNEVLTIKTNEAHTDAIFRSESACFYDERWWETANPTGVQMDNEALERLKRKYGK